MPYIKHMTGELFIKIAEISRDVFWMKSADYRKQIYVSPSFDKVWGFSREKLYTDPNAWHDSIVHEDRKLVEQFIQRRTASFESNTLEQQDISYRIQRPDGEIRWINDGCFVLFDEEEQAYVLAGIARDVTLEELKGKELRYAAKFFEQFAEKSESVFWVREPKSNKQLYLSPAYEKIWGRSRESLYENPSSWIDTLVEDDRDLNTANARANTLNKFGKVARYESIYRIKLPDGELKWIKDNSFPIFDNNVCIGFAGIAEDITKEKINEQRLIEAKEKAEAASRAKTEFIAIVSHEMRTPLNGILGMAQFLLNDTSLSAAQHEKINDIYVSGKLLLTHINDILDVSLLEADKLEFQLEPFDLREVITDTLRNLSSIAASKGIELQINYPEHLPRYFVSDSGRICQILFNLLGNALKFTREGTVSLTVGCTQLANNTAEVSFIVKDTGIGIPADKLDFIFERFNQIESSYKGRYRGTGLGLAIVKQMLKNLGGSIEVSSELGKGSTFTCKLPLTIQQEVQLKQFKAEQKKVQRQTVLPFKFNLKILLIEDDKISQRVAQNFLEELNCQITITDTAEQALALLKENTNFDIILTDIGLPGISGLELIEKIRHHKGLNKKIPIITLTAHAQESDRANCLAAGADDVLTKPLARDDLQAILSKWQNKTKSQEVE